jgi:two-component system, NtrC family, sensor kinase
MRLRLTLKYTLVTSLVVLGIMTFFAAFSVRTMEKISMDDAMREVDSLSETIIRTTHYQMLEDDRKRVYQMIEEVGSQKGIERIRLLNKEGLITFSTEESEIGHLIDEQAEGCSGCHETEIPLTHAPAVNRSRVFVDTHGVTVLGVIKEIPNKTSCSVADCHFHPQDASFLGILDVQVSLEGMKSQVGAYRNDMVVFTMMMLFFLALCLMVLTGHLVNDPVNKLLAHTRKLARGEWDALLGNGRKDELGELSHAFNELTIKLKAAKEELEEWGRNLEVKVEERTREIKEIQAQLVRSEKLASVGELAAGIAHEINNPLTGILVFSSLLRNNPRLDPLLLKDVDIVVQETGRCARIVKGLLDFARETTPRKALVSLSGVMDRALSLVENQTMFHDIEIIKYYDGALPDILVDQHQIEQVFINMLVNAGQAMDGGGRLEISTGRVDEEDLLHVTIADSGCGIPQEDLKKIFDPFFSTKEDRGTGLGLSVSYGIIENHGGRIEVHSKVGKGTKFVLFFPLILEDGEAEEEEGSPA